MASAVRWQIMQRLLTVLKGLTWQPEDEDVGRVSAIDIDTGIVFRKVSIAERPDDIGHAQDILPGIIVSCPRVDFQMNYDHGTNLLEQVPIRFLIQIIDRDSETKTGGEKTYWKWQEICFTTLSESVEKFNSFESGTAGDIVSVRVNTVDCVDERYWVAHSAFVAGVEIEFQVLFART